MGVRLEDDSDNFASISSLAIALFFMSLIFHKDLVHCELGSVLQMVNPSAATIVVKEVIQPQVPLRLPCYDFVPVMNHTVVTVLPKVKLATSGAIHSHDVTGGVYKARERIHRDILIRDY